MTTFIHLLCVYWKQSRIHDCISCVRVGSGNNARLIITFGLIFQQRDGRTCWADRPTDQTTNKVTYGVETKNFFFTLNNELRRPKEKRGGDFGIIWRWYGITKIWITKNGKKMQGNKRYLAEEKQEGFGVEIMEDLKKENQSPKWSAAPSPSSTFAQQEKKSCKTGRYSIRSFPWLAIRLSCL